jgi:hypothetical protein
MSTAGSHWQKSQEIISKILVPITAVFVRLKIMKPLFAGMLWEDARPIAQRGRRTIDGEGSGMRGDARPGQCARCVFITDQGMS